MVKEKVINVVDGRTSSNSRWKLRDLPEMTDESAARFRQKLVGLGLIKEPTEKFQPVIYSGPMNERFNKWFNRPVMTVEEVKKLKDKYYKLGIITPRWSR